MKDEHKLKRKETRLATKEARKGKLCKVYELKFDYSHLSKEKTKHLDRLFLEAKWIYNDILSSEDIFNYDSKVSQVNIKNKDGELESRDITNLSSQMKQGLVDRTKSSMLSLSSNKRKGKSVGKLKFKSQVSSIPLKQFNITYKILNNKYIRLQGFKRSFKVLGLNQIPENVEYANANLIKKNNNFYLKVTCFVSNIEKKVTNNVIGFDFGIKDDLIDSYGNTYNFKFSESKNTKKLSKKLHKAKLGSNNRFKIKQKLQKSYAKTTNQKKDVKNKFINFLTTNFDTICIQDEMIYAWAKSKMKGWGRKIQHSIRGGILSDLKEKSETVLIERSFPSTQLCPNCGTLNKHSIDKRMYNCSCGYSSDRDTHSAKNILKKGLIDIGTERINMPAELKSDLLEFLQKNFNKHFAMKQEAQVL